MKRKKILRVSIISLCLIMLLTTLAFGATTLMSYNGTGIRDKESAQTFNLSKKSSVTVNHASTAVGVDGFKGTIKLTVYLQKKNSNGNFVNTSHNFSLTGSGKKEKKVTWSLEKGTYRLYFKSTKDMPSNVWPQFDVKGTVTI